MSYFKGPVIAPGSLNPSLRFRVPGPEGPRSGRSWAIASATGGAGRSSISALLGARLVASGFTSCIVDADWSNPSMTPLLGLPGGEGSNFWCEDLPLQWEQAPHHQDLSILRGAPPAMASPSREQCLRLLERLYELPHKQLVLDLPAGVHDSALELWLKTDFPVLLAIPERLPLEATARLLARVFALQATPWLQQRLGLEQSRAVLNQAWRECLGRTGTWMRTVARLAQLEADELAAHVGSKPIHLVLNRLRCAEDVDIGHALVTAAGHGLGLDLRFRAALPFHEEGWIGARRPTGAGNWLSGGNSCLFTEEIDEFLERMSNEAEVPQPGSWRWQLRNEPLSRTAEP